MSFRVTGKEIVGHGPALVKIVVFRTEEIGSDSNLRQTKAL